MNQEIIDTLDKEIAKREKRLEELAKEKADIMDELINLRGTRLIFGKEPITIEPIPAYTPPITNKKDVSERVKELEQQRPCPYRDFSDLIQCFMKDNGLNCTELAGVIQMSPDQVRLWKDNKSVPQKRFRDQLAESLEGLSANTVKRCDVIKALELSDSSERA